MVLSLENSRGKRLDVVIVIHRHRFLHHDRTAVELRRNEMYRRARPFHPVFPRLILRVRARKGRQERRMDIHDRVWEFAQERVG